MEKIDALKTDFHTLKVLGAVHRLRSVTAAANELGLTQSTVSYTIDRLRDVFRDPLFVKSGRGIRPTTRCDEIAPRIALMLQGFDEVLRSHEFVPSLATEDDNFVVSTNFYERYVLIPGVVTAMQQQAPRARLSVLHSALHGDEQLLDGACDLLLSPVPYGSEHLFRRKLLTDPYVCFVDRDSKWANTPMSVEDFVRAGHIVVKYDGSYRPFFMNALDEMGIAIEPIVTMPSFGGIDRAIEGTDLVLTAQSFFGHLFAERVVAIQAPFTSSVTFYMYWTARTHSSSAQRWLRGLVAKSAARASRRLRSDIVES